MIIQQNGPYFYLASKRIGLINDEHLADNIDVNVDVLRRVMKNKYCSVHRKLAIRFSTYEAAEKAFIEYVEPRLLMLTLINN